MKISIHHDHRARLGQVRDQGRRLTCLAHAATAAHEGLRPPPVQLSPEYLHYFSTNRQPKDGATFPATATALEVHGQPLEEHCPYKQSQPEEHWEPTAPPHTFRRAAEERGAVSTEIVHLLSDGSTPVLGISITEPFFDPHFPWVIDAEGSVCGRHAVVAVGLGECNGRQLILVRNSWGSGWADGGHAWLHGEFLSSHLHDVMILKDEVNP